MKVKRILSLLLALVMVVSLMGGICLTASADEVENDLPENIIPVIEISGIPEAVIGEEILRGEAIVPEGAGYTAEYYWTSPIKGFDEFGGITSGLRHYYNDEHAVFEDGTDYTLSVVITLDDSWEGWECYTEGDNLDVIILVNGEQRVWEATYFYDNDEYLYYDEYFCFSEPISSVEIFNVPHAVVGEVASVDGITVPEDAPYSISEAEWINWADSSSDPVNGQVFEIGGNYSLCMVLELDEGYHFVEDCVFYADGEECLDTWGAPWYVWIYLDEGYTYGTIDSVDISYNDAEPVVGEQPDCTVEVPEGANYQAWIEWYEVSGDSWYGVDTFEAGKEYVRIVVVSYNEGYRFAEDTVVTANGQILESDSYWCDEYGVNIYDYYYTEGSTEGGEEPETSVIWNVDLSGLQEPVVGEPLTQNVSVLTDGCTVTSLNWYVWENEELIPVSGIAEKGKEYRAEVVLTADEGYAFDMDITNVYMDGEWMDMNWIGEDEACVYMLYDTREVIESIELTSTDKAELGAPATSNGASVPENANYTVSAYWGALNMEEGLTPFTGNFADNTVYAYVMDVVPAEGYKFADELTITYNGEPVSEMFGYWDEDYAEVIGEVFTGTMQKIRKVELKTRFAAGMKVGDATVEVPENAPYEVKEYFWIDVQTGEEVQGKFQKGKQYGLMTYVVPKSGYVIEMDAQTLVDGTDDYEMMQTQHAYIYGQVAVILQCEAADAGNSGEAGGNPATGDGFNIVLLSGVMLLSVMGLIFVVPKKYSGQ